MGKTVLLGLQVKNSKPSNTKPNTIPTRGIKTENKKQNTVKNTTKEKQFNSKNKKFFNDRKSNQSLNNQTGTMRRGHAQLIQKVVASKMKHLLPIRGPNFSNEYLFSDLGMGETALAIVDALHLQKPTEVQAQTIPLILQGNDIVAMARTGSGKTLAFLLPLIDKLKKHSTIVGSRAYILGPSREILIQTYKVWLRITDALKKIQPNEMLSAALLVGGLSLEAQFAALAMNPDIIMSTPGRLVHMFIETTFSIRAAQILILDEADLMVDSGLSLHMGEIFKKIPATKQTILFSATLSRGVEDVSQLGLVRPVIVKIHEEDSLPSNVHLHALFVIPDSKISTLLSVLWRIRTKRKSVADTETSDIIQNAVNSWSGLGNSTSVSTLFNIGSIETNSSSIKPNPKSFSANVAKILKSSDDNSQLGFVKPTVIFAATTHAVNMIALVLERVKIKCSIVYGAMQQDERNRQLERFCTFRTSVLVVTDVAARGLDMPEVTCVINYDFPASARTFVHRVGRCGRRDQESQAISLVSLDDMPYFLRALTALKIGVQRGCGIKLESAAEETKQYASIGITVPNPSIKSICESLNEDDEVQAAIKTSDSARLAWQKHREPLAGCAKQLAGAFCDTLGGKSSILIEPHEWWVSLNSNPAKNIKALISGYKPATESLKVNRKIQLNVEKSYHKRRIINNEEALFDTTNESSYTIQLGSENLVVSQAENSKDFDVEKKISEQSFMQPKIKLEQGDKVMTTLRWSAARKKYQVMQIDEFGKTRSLVENNDVPTEPQGIYSKWQRRTNTYIPTMGELETSQNSIRNELQREVYSLAPATEKLELQEFEEYEGYTGSHEVKVHHGPRDVQKEQGRINRNLNEEKERKLKSTKEGRGILKNKRNKILARRLDNAKLIHSAPKRSIHLIVPNKKKR